MTTIPEWIVKYDQQNYQSGAGKAVRELMQRISRLEATLEAADEVIDLGISPGSSDFYEMGQNEKYYEALEKYNQLKSNQQSPNS